MLYTSGHWLALEKFCERPEQLPEGPGGCRGKKFVVESRRERAKVAGLGGHSCSLVEAKIA